MIALSLVLGDRKGPQAALFLQKRIDVQIFFEPFVRTKETKFLFMFFMTVFNYF